MKELHSATTNPSGGDDKDEMGLVDILVILAERKKIIAGVTIAVAIAAAVVSMLLPPSYKATVKLLPPQQAQSSTSMLLSQLGGLAGAAAGVGGLKNPADVYIGMLKSRTVAERLTNRFSLQKHYEITSKEKTWTLLESNSVIAAGKDGLISIQVEDKDQKLVAPLANAYVDELVRLTKTLAVTEAAQRRLFFEQELERSKDKLAKAEVALKTAIDQRGVVSVDTESRALLETVARLHAAISAKEIERDSMKAFVTSSHPEYQRVEESLRSLRAELSRLENGNSSVASSNPDVVDGAKTGVQNIQLLRDVKYYQMLYELLAKQYEAARLDEAKDSSVIQVLDPAIEPETKFKPKRAMLVLAASFLACVAAIIGVLLWTAKQRRRLSSHSSASSVTSDKARA
jgi:tyrosine-protein kinase Etk/Wzc